jgi:hypothetical protein
MDRKTDESTQRHVMVLERGVKRTLACIAAILVVIAVELAMLTPGRTPAVQAQIPDTALQRQNILAETQRTNELLQKILGHLQSKSIKVVMQGAEKGASGNAPRSSR